MQSPQFTFHIEIYMFERNSIEVRVRSKSGEIKCTSRNIPEPMKRNIRQRCGFGCVICGFILYDYDHMLHDWANVREHVESDITLLCPIHHREKTSGLLTRQMVAAANENPYNLEKNHTSPYLLNFAGTKAIVIIANNVFANNTSVDDEGFETPPYMIPVLIDGFPVIGFRIEDDRLLLNVHLFDEYNHQLLAIHDNQLIFSPETWDVYIKGSTLCVREGPRKIILEMDFSPPNKVVINRAKIRFNGVELELMQDHVITNGVKSVVFKYNHFTVPVGISIGNPQRFPQGAINQWDVDRYGGECPASVSE